MGLGWDETADLLAAVRAFVTVEPVTVGTHELGLALAERHGLSVYDAMIVAAGLLAGCDTLLSEDMQHGFVVAGQMTIVNPFAPSHAGHRLHDCLPLGLAERNVRRSVAAGVEHAQARATDPSCST